MAEVASQAEELNPYDPTTLVSLETENSSSSSKRESPLSCCSCSYIPRAHDYWTPSNPKRGQRYNTTTGQAKRGGEDGIGRESVSRGMVVMESVGRCSSRPGRPVSPLAPRQASYQSVLLIVKSSPSSVSVRIVSQESVS